MCSHSAHKDEKGIPFVWKHLSIPLTITPPTDPAIEELGLRLSNRAHNEACPECPLQPSVRLIIFTGGTNS